MNCIDCNRLIDELNDSREHLILNAIGGRKRVRGLLCRVCNPTAGYTWDKELASQLAPLSSLFAVKRQRGETQPQKVTTASGETFYRRPDGVLVPSRPVYKEVPRSDGTVQVQIQARTMEEARDVLRGAKRKYPNIDVEKTLAKVQIEQRYLDEPVRFSCGIGGAQAGRSIVKSALCLAVSSGVDPRACTDACAYLKKAEAVPCFGYYYQRDLLLNRPKAVPLHCVAVSNRGTEGQLLAYAEFFGVHRVVIRLAEDYAGPDIHVSYAVNPMLGKKLDVTFSLAFPREDIAACYAYERIPPGSIEAAYDEVMPVALKNDLQREWQRAWQSALSYGLANCGAASGEMITAEHMRRASQLAAEKLQPFVSRHLIRRDPPATR